MHNVVSDLVDAVVVGQFVGKTALAAVGGSAVAIINLLLNFFVGLCSGAAIAKAVLFSRGKLAARKTNA